MFSDHEVRVAPSTFNTVYIHYAELHALANHSKDTQIFHQIGPGFLGNFGFGLPDSHNQNISCCHSRKVSCQQSTSEYKAGHKSVVGFEKYRSIDETKFLIVISTQFLKQKNKSTETFSYLRLTSSLKVSFPKNSELKVENAKLSSLSMHSPKQLVTFPKWLCSERSPTGKLLPPPEAVFVRFQFLATKSNAALQAWPYPPPTSKTFDGPEHWLSNSRKRHRNPSPNHPKSLRPQSY